MGPSTDNGALCLDHFFASIFACVILLNREWMTTIRMMYEEGDDSQLHTALAHIIIIAAVWAATPLGTVVRVTHLHARQRTAGPPTRGHAGAVQHASKTHHTCVKITNKTIAFNAQHKLELQRSHCFALF